MGAAFPSPSGASRGEGGALVPCREGVHVYAGGGEDFLELAALGGIFPVGAG